MRGVCALNMEAMSMFRGGGNGSVPGHQEEIGSDVGHEGSEVAESEVELEPSTHHTPSHSAPFTHHRGNQMNIPQVRYAQSPSQNSHLPPPHTLPTSQQPTTAVATSSVIIQTSQPRAKVVPSSRGQSSVGVASHRKGRGHTRPAVMVERHNLG